MNRCESASSTRLGPCWQALRRDSPAKAARFAASSRGTTKSSRRSPISKFEIPNPELWWPNGHGDHPLYDVRLELVKATEVLDRWSGRIGLRTIALDRHPDEFGESFQFVVNGRPIFAKGANWIPAHSFVGSLTRDDYEDLLTSAEQAHMNMIRVWGGGIYEMEDFYDLCDEKGLLVWQDFMFACAVYPGGPEFLASVKAEAEHQVKRLANRACLALWCGNNEIEQMPGEITKTAQRRKAYEEIFYQILPEAVARYDGETAYWPSSPHNPEGYAKGPNNEKAGDSHFWDVWHAKQPVKRYEKKGFRFCSEFGMQSFSSPEVAATVLPAGRMRRVRAGDGEPSEKPGGQSHHQGLCFSKIPPRSRLPFACLPFADQSGLLHEGRRRAFPPLDAAHNGRPILAIERLLARIFMEQSGIWRALESAPLCRAALLCAGAGLRSCPWRRADGHGKYLEKQHSRDSSPYRLRRAGQDHRFVELDSLSPRWPPPRSGREERFPRIWAIAPPESPRSFTKAEDPRRAQYLPAHQAGNRARSRLRGHCLLQRSALHGVPACPISTTVERTSQSEFQLGFHSRGFQHAVQIDLPGLAHKFEDNFFDLYPGEMRKVRLHTEKAAMLAEIKRTLKLRSLADTAE